MTRHLNLLAVSPDDATPIGTPGADPANTPEAAVPSASGALLYTTVEPSDVEIGDRLAGFPGHPEVARIVYAGVSGEWLFGDANDNLICHVGVGTLVQICVDETELVAGVERHPAGGAR